MVGAGDVKTNFEMEMDEIRSAFDRMDTDGNGHVRILKILLAVISTLIMVMMIHQEQHQ